MKKIVRLIIAAVVLYVGYIYIQNTEYTEANPERIWIDTPSDLPGQLVVHDGYITDYNQVTLIPNWVSYELLPKNVVKDGASRTDKFTEDPLLLGLCASTMDYSRSGYDRGHMAPAADFKYSEEAMAETFYMTNICPQNHNLNSGAWNDLESQIRWWCKHYYRTPIMVMCGPVMGKRPKKIGDNRVAVPASFWKVVCRKDLLSGEYHAVGFLFPNKETDRSYDSFAVPIDSIETLTGLDLLTNLPEEQQQKLESSVEIANWKTDRR